MQRVLRARQQGGNGAHASSRWRCGPRLNSEGVAVVVIPGEVFLSQLSNPDWTIGPVLPTRSVLRPADESFAPSRRHPQPLDTHHDPCRRGVRRGTRRSG